MVATPDLFSDYSPIDLSQYFSSGNECSPTSPVDIPILDSKLDECSIIQSFSNTAQRPQILQFIDQTPNLCSYTKTPKTTAQKMDITSTVRDTEKSRVAQSRRRDCRGKFLNNQVADRIEGKHSLHFIFCKHNF